MVPGGRPTRFAGVGRGLKTTASPEGQRHDAGDPTPAQQQRRKWQRKAAAQRGNSGAELNAKPVLGRVKVSGAFDCVRMSPQPRPLICLHPVGRDRYISHDLRAAGVWEPAIVRTFQWLLRASPADVGVIDIGANIGQYSLLAAAMGYRVVAVEPQPDNLRLFRHAVRLGEFDTRITILERAVSDTRAAVGLSGYADNQGAYNVRQPPAEPCTGVKCPTPVTAMYMDDILETKVAFRRAIMKIDIELHEPQAFRYSARLFEEIFVSHIIMEWHFGVRFDKGLVTELMKRLLDRGYVPHYADGRRRQLDTSDWRKWPGDVLWIHRDAARPPVA